MISIRLRDLQKFLQFIKMILGIDMISGLSVFDTVISEVGDVFNLLDKPDDKCTLSPDGNLSVC